MLSWREEARVQLGLALPTIVVQLGMIAMAVVDVAMVGRHDTVDLAGLGIGHSYAFAIVAFGMGILLAIDPLVSQAVGAGDERALARGIQRGLVLALVISVPVGLAILTTRPALALAGIDPEVAGLASAYAHTKIASLPAFYGFFVLRLPLQATFTMLPVVVVTLAANLVNVVSNYGLIYGRFGLPEMGVVGCGWSTVVCRWLMLAGLVAAAWPVLGRHLTRLRRDALRLAPLVRTVLLGLPIGVQLVLEIGGFGAIAILMGKLSTDAIAAHQVALNLASVSFMVPLGLSIAAAVRVGNEIGAGRAPGARHAAKIALAAGAGAMALSGAVFFVAAGPLARLYTDDASVVALATVLIRIAAAFQVFDGIQVVCSGILRGTGETRLPMVIHLIGFWVLGVPVGYALAFGADAGARGLWWGLVVGLASAAALLVFQVRRRFARDLQRLIVDREEIAAA